MKNRTALVFVAFLCVAPVSGLYVQPEVRSVPVARLVQNLERERASAPENPESHIRLARLYGMAYAINANEVPVARFRPGGPEQIWFGHEPDLVPHRLKTAPDVPRSETAQAYLRQATEHYRMALELDPGSLLARLGYGWTLEQAGDGPAAIAEYRRVIEEAWPKESTIRTARLGQRFYTEEAAGYLIPLLDPQRDARELNDLRSRMERFEAVPRPITPIAVPLSAEAQIARLLDGDASVPFDADGSGLRRRWTWITGEAGWLVYDARGNGQITSALQWFGNVTFWLFWTNGYEALAALDDDGDGELRESELRHLAIWHDANGNGVSEAGEVRPLSSHGIIALSCRFTPGDGVRLAARSDRGARFLDGTHRPTFDVILQPASLPTPPVP